VSFQGKSIIVTGASSGLGAAMADTFAKAGAKLTLFARRQKELDLTAERCREAGGEVTIVAGDVTDLEDCRRLVEVAVTTYGGLDVIVANAGVSMWARFEDVADTSLYRQLIDVNYMGVVNCLHPALPYLKERKGIIAAISSIQGKIPVPLHTGYVASKHALQGFLDTLRGELRGTGVDVITACPHWLRGTELRKSAFDKAGDRIGDGRRSHSKESISLEDCSVAIVKAIARRDREVVIPWKLTFLPWLKLIAPGYLDRLVRGEMDRQD
jgi:short-subunit dehydrogenase